MKNLTNILSYLWLLLLMAVTACSDLEEEVGPMQGEEEVELNIQLHVPDIQASTRAQMEITEKISTIVAIAFDESGALIKKVNATLTPTNDYQGTLKIKVPKRTQTIHFLGNYTKDDIGSITSLETLNSFTTTDADATTMPTMRYWGKAEYNGGNNLSVTLYRNMAKLTLKKGEGFTANSCYIAGFVNRNLSGTIVPSGYQVGDTPTIPNNVQTGTYQADNSLGNVYYLFEHANVENNNPLYVIIEVAAKYYKVAFAAGDEYFPIIRNHEYTITIDGIDAMYAENYYTDAVNSQYPINDLVITSVPMTVTPDPAEVQNESGQTFTVTVTIPEGITELNVPTHDAFDITPPNSLTLQNGKYPVTQGSYVFTFTVKGGVEAGNKTISFSGRGKYKSATGSATVNLYEIVQITAELTPQITSLNYSANSVSDLIVNVTIPAGVTTLNFSSDYFDVEFINSTSLTDNGNGSYTVTGTGNAPISADARLRLKNKTATQNAGFTFSGTGEGVMVTPATINNITLQTSGDENVRWQGDVELSYDYDARKIVLPYSWFSSVPAGSKLRVEYDIIDTNGPIIQFSEVEGEKWDEPGFHFPELETTTNNGKIGCNLSDKKSDTGYWIYGTNESAFTGSASFDLTLSQDVLTALADNRRPNLFGGEDIVIAIQGENVRLKKISVIPKADIPENAPLSKIELDFYSAENRDNNVYEDLLLGTSHLYLTATISAEDAVKYAGQSVTLVNTFSGNGYQYANSNGAIHWDYSEIETSEDGYGKIACNSDGTQLQFTIDPNETDYLIKWVFVTGQHYKGGDIGFTYNISNYAISDVDGTFNNFAGNTSATIGFTNEPIYLDIYSDADTDAGNDISIVSGSQLVMKATLSSDIDPGETITFNLSNSTDGIYSITWNENNSASSAKMDWPNITLTVVQGQSDYYLYWYPTVSDERSATLNFTVNDYDLNSVGNSSYSKKITVSRTVIDDEDFSNFKNVGPGSVSVEDGILCLTNNTDRQNAWDAQAMYETNGIKYGETYTLTFKAKIANNTQGEMAVAIQRFENEECVATDHYRIFTINDINNAKKENQDWAEFTYDITIQDNNQETPNENNPTHFMFNFGDLVGTLNIYDLTLVKKN